MSKLSVTFVTPSSETTPAGGAFGFLVGVLLCYVCFTVLPLMESVIPLENFRTLADQSVLAKTFSDSSLIVSIMNRKL